MKKIINVVLHTGSLKYVAFSLVTASLVVFAIMPLLPNAHKEANGPSLTANLVAAFGGDAGGDGGGAGDAGAGAGDAGTGGGVGDPGAGTGDSGSTGGGTGDAGTGTGGTGSTGGGVGDPGTGTGDSGSTGGGVGDVGTGTGDPGSTGGGVGDAGAGCCGDAGAPGDTGSGDTGTNGPGDTVLMPSCIVSATPNSLPSSGGNATLAWSSENATNISLDITYGSTLVAHFDSVSPVDSMPGFVDRTVTYTFTATNSVGSVTCSETITVAPVLPLGWHEWGEGTQPPQSCVISGWAYDPNSASPIDVHIYVGGTYQTGTILDAVRAGDSRPDVGAAVPGATNSGFTYTLPSSYHDGVARTYYVYAINSNGVGPNPLLSGSPKTMTCTPDSTPVPAPTCTLTATPASINQGQSSQLSWTTTNATQVSLNQNIGSVSANGSQSVAPSNTTSYTLTATGPGGTVSCVREIVVTTPNPTPACTLSVSPSSINQGQSSQLSWTTQNASSVSIDQGIGWVALNGSQSIAPSASKTYTLTATGAGGTVTCQKTVTVVSTPNAPKCTLSASTTELPYTGGPVTLSWTTEDANNVTLNQSIGSVSLQGSRTVPVSANTNFTLTATGPGGVVTCSKSITVASLPQAPTCTLTATPASINQGQSSQLSWTTSRASSVMIDQGVGTVAPDGTRSVSPSATKTYTLTAVGDGGVTICTKTVTVTPPIVHEVPTCTLTATPASINQGQSSQLSWTTTNASSVVIDQGVGSVNTNGSQSIAPSASKTYTLTATGAGGTVNCQKTVTVIPTPSAPTCTLSVSPSSINQGQSSQLSWTTTNASSVVIDQGVGSVNTNGSQSIAPSASKTYTLTATGAGGTVTCQKSVTVVPQPEAPTCTLTATNISITPGQSSTLNWTTTNATQVSLNQNIGSVSANGSHSVAPSSTTSYTLTATGPGGTVSCAREIMVTTPNPAPTCTLNATPASINQGQSSQLSWTTTNASSVMIDQGVGSVNTSGSQSIAPSASKTYTLTATGAGGTVTCQKSVTVTTTPNAPTCTLTSNRSAITAGESATLTWTSEHGNTSTLNGVTVTPSGSSVVTPATTTTYSFVVSGPGGSKTCSQTITVTPYVPVSPVCTLSLNTPKITKGQSAILTWSTGNTSSVSLDQSIGSVPLSGNRTVSPTSNTTYTLTALGEANKTVTCVASLVVENEPEPTPLTCDAFTASPSTLSRAGTTTLTWNTSNASSVSINQGVGAVSVDGSKVVSVSTTTLFTLTAEDGGDKVTCQTQVTVAPVSVIPKCDAFTVSPTSVTKGNTATLTWSTTNATNVSINNGVGSVSPDGSTAVTVNANTTYVLTASNGDGLDICQTTVTIKSSGGGGGGSSAPRCTLTASDKTIKPGEAVTLSWNNTRTNDILLKDNRGKIILDSKKDNTIDEDKGTVVVKPTRSTAYTLTAIRGSQDRDCTVDINVSDVSVSSTRSQEPLVAGISLSRVPYTGFDAGPMLTTIFYALLVLWGLGIAYVLVMRQGHPHYASPARAFMESVKAAEAKVEEKKVVPTPVTPTVMAMPGATVPRDLPTATYTPIVGYSALYNSQEIDTEEAVPTADGEAMDMAFLEERAHDRNVLVSSDALHFVMSQSAKREERMEVLDMVIDVAKATYPNEDGWIVINKERILSLLK